MNSKRLAIITSHPIQYNAPLFQMLSARGVLSVKVFYTWGVEAIGSKYDPGFKKDVEWNVPLLDGYAFEFLENISKHPGTHHFRGIVNPGIVSSINNFRPDAILVFGWAFHSHLVVLRKFKNIIPVFFRGDSTLLDDAGGLKSVLRRLFLTWIYSHIDKALYVGKHNYDYFRKFGVDQSKLAWAPHTIDNDRFMADDEERRVTASTNRIQYNVPVDGFVFLFSGKLEIKKDPDLLLQAFIESGLFNHCHLVFAGSGELETSLRTKAEKYPSIHFIGFQNQLEMPIIYRLADVLVLPSRGPGETWGLAINEAMACATPVIASNKCGGAIDLIEDGKNGYIVEAGNLDDLKEKLIKIYQDRDRLDEMGQQALKKVRTFSMDAVCTCIEQLVA